MKTSQEAFNWTSFSSSETEVLRRVAEEACSLDFGTLLERVLKEVVAALGGDAGGIFIIEGAQPVLRAQVGHTEQIIRLKQLLNSEDQAAADLADSCLSPEVVLKEGRQAYARLPLITAGNILGAVLVTAREKQRFTSIKADWLAAIGRQIGLAVERIRLHSEAQRRANNQSLLNRISLLIGSSLDEQEVLHEIVNGLRTLLNVKQASVYIWDAGADTLHQRKSLLEHAPSKFRLGEGLVGIVAQRRQPLVVPRMKEFPLVADGSFAARFNLTSFAGVPILRGDELLGALTVLTTEERHFTDEDIELLAAFSNHAATAIRNFQLVGQLRDALQRQEALQKAAAELVSTMDSEELLQHIMPACVGAAVGRPRGAVDL